MFVGKEFEAMAQSIAASSDLAAVVVAVAVVGTSGWNEELESFRPADGGRRASAHASVSVDVGSTVASTPDSGISYALCIIYEILCTCCT
jgi:hypothetical protein